jgi:deoxyxylulose-5-phosphate synthase
VVAVIGDGALSGGMAFKALNLLFVRQQKHCGSVTRAAVTAA